jgi:predicted transporter
MPKHPTLGAFKRSMTYSFGSICFGSLIVSIIQLLKQAASLAQAQTDSIVGTIIVCFVQIIIAIAQWLAEFFNVC